MQKIHWGILATGGIAHSLAEALSESEEAEICAVASRSAAKAAAFAAKWNIPASYGNYQDLVEDPAVEVVYIATPHSLHYENMLMCLEAGKHVLCEKAFTLNAAQAQECIDLARHRNLFLMEAMWMRFFPAMAYLRKMIHQQLLGEIRLVQADFCIDVPFDPQHRLYDMEKGGGALLDLGIYPLSLSAMILGLPEKAQGYARINKTGADVLDNICLTYPGGAGAFLTCSQRVFKPREAFIAGSKGYIKIHDVFYRPDHLTVQLHGEPAEEKHFPFTGNGYAHEIAEVHSCLKAGKTESSIMPLNETLELMKIMDNLRALWGVSYPQEG